MYAEALVIVRCANQIAEVPSSYVVLATTTRPSSRAVAWLQFWLQFTGVRAGSQQFISAGQDSHGLPRTRIARTHNLPVPGFKLASVVADQGGREPVS